MANTNVRSYQATYLESLTCLHGLDKIAGEIEESMSKEDHQRFIHLYNACLLNLPNIGVKKKQEEAGRTLHANFAEMQQLLSKYVQGPLRLAQVYAKGAKEMRDQEGKGIEDILRSVLSAEDAERVIRVLDSIY